MSGLKKGRMNQRYLIVISSYKKSKLYIKKMQGETKKRGECVIEFTGSLAFGVLMWRMRKGLVIHKKKKKGTCSRRNNN